MDLTLKELGDTGVRLPDIAFGTWRYGGGAEPLKQAIALGGLFIDSAEMYRTEHIVAEAIEGRRQETFVATKVSGSHLRPQQVAAAAEASLKLLRSEYIDLYQIHWPDPAVPIEETMGALERLADQGKVRFIGVSNFSLEEMQAAQSALSRHRIQANQVTYSLLRRQIEADLLPYCEEHRVSILAYSPLGRGMLTRKPRIRRHRGLAELDRVAKAEGKDMAQVALNWCTASPQVFALTKTERVERVEGLLGASGWRLAPEHKAALDQAFD